MIHQRHVIREAIVARLAAGGTAAGARVYEHPTDPRTGFPALQVEDVAETQQMQTLPFGASATVERELLIDITAELQQTSAYARARDQLLADVESLLMSTPIPGVRVIRPAGYQAETLPGERPIALGRQRFALVYHTTAGNPAQAI